jgi:hypothetical protein
VGCYALVCSYHRYTIRSRDHYDNNDNNDNNNYPCE